MDKISSVWAELQLSNRLPSGTLMSSCQTELQELMYQLDVMLSAKKQQWMQETEELQTQLHAKERELRSQQTALEIKTREMEDVKNQMEGLNKAQKAIVDEYEDHLSSLRAEVLKVRKEYEKLHRQHQRYKKDLQRKKDQVLAEKKESDKEIRRLREKLEEYEGKEQEWEVKFKGQQHENDMLEAQNRTLAEKCQFVQQQSATYQSQVGRRREMQDTAEDSLKARITQLEASLDRSAQTVLSQKDKIEKLKGSLEDAMTSHKQTMGDNEKLLTDLQKANETIQLLEERIAELEDELRSKAQMLHAAQDDSRQYSHDLLNMEHTLNAKDEIIKHMGGPQEYQESEQVKKLKDALQKAKDDLKRILRKNIWKANSLWSQKQSQQSLKQATSSSSTSAISAISASSTPKSSVNMSQNYRDSPQLHKQQELKEKIEVQCLQLEVQKLQEQVLSVNDVHGTELTSMRKKLGELTTELNQRNASLATLSEKSSELERSLRDESDTLDKKVAELKVAHAQVQLLRAENGQLRRDRLHEGNLDGDGSIPSNSASHVMRREMHVLRNSVEDMEHIMRNQHNSARTETSHNETSHTNVMSDRHSGSQGNTESGSERHGAMDEYLHSNIRRYDDQLQFLETQKARLEAQMSESSRQNLRIAAEERKLHEAAERRNPHCDHHHDETQGSEAMSLVSEGHFPKIDRLQLPNSSSDDELPDMAEDASRAFYSQEHQYTDQLERRLNARINNFTHGLDH